MKIFIQLFVLMFLAAARAATGPGGGGSGTATNLSGNALKQVTNIVSSLTSTGGISLLQATNVATEVANTRIALSNALLLTTNKITGSAVTQNGDGTVTINTGGGGGGSVITYYVDGVNGSDSNGGTNISTPWLTLGQITNALGASPGNKTIRLARGSHWREEIYFGTNNLIGAYGSGPEPIISACDIATNSTWVKVTGFTNLWAQSNWTARGAGYISVAENSVQLFRSNALASVDGTPGTFWASATNATNGGTYVVVIHPRGDTTPTNDLKLYEISKRGYALYAADNNTVEDLHTRGPQFSNNGSLELGRNALIRRSLIENGTKHNFLFASGVMEDCVIQGQEYNGDNANTLVVFDNSDGLEYVIRRTTVKDTPAATAFYAHTLGSGYKSATFEDCAAINTQSFGSPGTSTNSVAIWNRVFSDRGGWLTGAGTNIFIQPVFTPRSPVSSSSGYVTIANRGANAWITGARFVGAPYGIVMAESNISLTLVDSILVGSNTIGSGISIDTSWAGASVTVSNSSITGYLLNYNLATNNSIAAAGSNVLGAANMNVNGVNYSLAAFQSAFPSLEVGSVTNDMLFAGNPFVGDLRYFITSPAVTNLAGGGWFPTPRLPLLPSFVPVLNWRQDSLAIGGVNTLGNFNSSTSALWSAKMNRSGDTASVFTVSGSWSNKSATHIQIDATDNFRMVLNKGNDNAYANEFYLGQAGSLYGGVRLAADAGHQAQFVGFGTGGSQIKALNAPVYVESGGGGADGLLVDVNGTTRMRLDASGNLLVTNATSTFAGSVIMTGDMNLGANNINNVDSILAGVGRFSSIVNVSDTAYVNNLVVSNSISSSGSTALLIVANPSTNTVVGTNWWLDANNGNEQTLTLTNNINVLGVTNTSGLSIHSRRVNIELVIDQRGSAVAPRLSFASGMTNAIGVASTNNAQLKSNVISTVSFKLIGSNVTDLIYAIGHAP